MAVVSVIHGLSERLTTAGIPVLRLHYSADPKKRAGTAAGAAWLAQAIQGYPGGTASPRWRKEMEIDWGVLGGTKLLPDWETWKTNGRIVVPPFTPTGYRLYASYDHGWRHKAAYHVHGVNGDGKKVTLWEFWADHVPLPLIAKIIKGEAVRVMPGHGHAGVREFPGNPYAGEPIWTVADPSIFAEDQAMNDQTMKSIAYLFEQEGVYFIEGQRGGDTLVAERLCGYDWLDPLNPTHVITTACPGLIWELGQQRHKEVSALVAQNRSQPEQLVDKDNDAFDSLKYFLNEFPPVPTQAKAVQKPNSFAWWREMAKKAADGDPVPTYQREMVG